jgi:hypothetical protein
MHRLKGELLLKQSHSNAPEAHIAAMTSMARLRAKQGCRDEARDAQGNLELTEASTADLKDAKAMLDELGT